MKERKCKATQREAETGGQREQTSMLRVANSTPMVDFESMLNSLRVNREIRLDLPTPESPTSTTCHPISSARDKLELFLGCRVQRRACELQMTRRGALQDAHIAPTGTTAPAGAACGKQRPHYLEQVVIVIVRLVELHVPFVVESPPAHLGLWLWWSG